MKDQSTLWMIVVCCIYLLATEITANFHYKFRRVPLSSRIKFSPAYMKTKWQNNLRFARPHMRPSAHPGLPLQKYPIYFYPLKASIPFIMPMNTRINPTINLQAIENNQPFHSNVLANPITEYEFHTPKPILEQNKELMIPTIPQHDDQGPIHTIPAPNLSSEPRPIIVEDVKNTAEPPINYPQIQHNNFIFGNDDKIIRNPLTGQYVLFAPDPSLPIVQRPSFNMKSTPSHNNNNNLSAITNDVTVGSLPTSQLSSYELSSYELLKLLNTHSQQQLVDSYGIPIAQQPQLQQHILQHQNLQENNTPERQILHFNGRLATPPDSNFLSQIREATMQNEAIKFNKEQPQYQTFSYDDQHQQNIIHGNNFALPQDIPKNTLPLTNLQNDNFYFNKNVNDNQQISAQQASENYKNNIFESHEQFNTFDHYRNDQNHFSTNQNISNSYPELNNQVYNEEVPFHYSTLPTLNDAETLTYFQNEKDVNTNDNVFKHSHRLNQIQVQPKQVEVNTPMTIYVPDEDYEDIETQINHDDNVEYNENNNYETTINQNDEDHRHVLSDYRESEDSNKPANSHWKGGYIKNNQINSETNSNSYESQDNVPFGTRLKLKTSVKKLN